MSLPRAKLSGAEYRKRAKDRKEEGNQIAAKMKKWLDGNGENEATTPKEIHDVEISKNSEPSSSSPKRDCLSTITKQSTIQPVKKQTFLMSSNQSNKDVETLHDESQQSGEEPESVNEERLNTNDPSTWPAAEELTDQLRSFLSSQTASLAENHSKLIEFSSTEREGRHLTFSMWFRTMPNEEKIKRSWLIYSKTKNALFCAPCKIYPNVGTSTLRTTGFTNWKKISERLSEHESSRVHEECMIKWKTRVQLMKTGKGIDEEMERSIRTEKEKWRQILHIIIDAVMYLATNCLSFRGSEENPSGLMTFTPTPSRGNFLNLIALLAKHNTTLKHQLDHLKKGQASYLSKTIQNEIVDLLAKTVRNEILEDIKRAKYFTIMFDCTPDISHTEQMSQVIRYVKIAGDVCEIKESFIDFVEVKGKTGEYITKQIIEKLTADGLDLGKCRGQSYDNGSNMAGAYKGVQARIAEINELAEFVPCLAHSLNLVGVHSASACPEAVNLFGIVQTVSCFFVSSTSRWDIMKKCTKTNLKGTSQTRWSAKYLAATALMNNLPDVVQALEHIQEENFNPQSKHEANHLQVAVTDFRFIVNLVIWSSILREINRVNIEIQKKDILLARSVALMQGLMQSLQRLRETSVNIWIEKAKTIAEKMGVEAVLQKKRVPKRKKMFDELCDDESRTLSAEQLFTQAINIVFDRIIAEIEKRVESAKSLNSYFSFLNGREIGNMSIQDLREHGADLALKYARDLNANDFCQELVVFREQAPLVFGDINDCNALRLLQRIYANDLQDAFPNLCIALRIYSTLPTTSASCERAFSKLKLIKNYLRSTMGQERLSSLAILSIENETAYATNFEQVIDAFAEQKARKVKFHNILS